MTTPEKIRRLRQLSKQLKGLQGRSARVEVRRKKYLKESQQITRSIAADEREFYAEKLARYAHTGR